MAAVTEAEVERLRAERDLALAALDQAVADGVRAEQERDALLAEVERLRGERDRAQDVIRCADLAFDAYENTQGTPTPELYDDLHEAMGRLGYALAVWSAQATVNADSANLGRRPDQAEQAG